MVRNITPTALEYLRNQFGTVPVNYMSIDWNGDGTYTNYSDKAYYGLPLEGKILELAGIESILKISGSGGTQAVSVKLDDSDLTLKYTIDTRDIHKKKVFIFQWWPGIDFTESILIFEGLILSPIIWSEGERTLSFEVVERLENKEVGFAPEEAQVDIANEEHVGQPWPLGFGTNIRIPAKRINDVPVGITRHPIAFPDPSLRLQMAKNALTIRDLEQAQHVNNIYALQCAFAAFSMRDQVRLLQNALDTLQNEGDITSILQSLGELQASVTTHAQDLEHNLNFKPSYGLPPGIVTVDYTNNTDEFSNDYAVNTGALNTYNSTLSDNNDAFAQNIGSDQPDLNQLQSDISQLQSAIKDQEGQQKSYEDQAAQFATQANKISTDNGRLLEQLQAQEKIGQITSVIDAWKFPKGPITVKIGDAYIEGSFDGDKFKPSSKPLNPIDRRDEFRPLTVDQPVNKGKLYIINPGATVKLISDYPIYYVVNILPSFIHEVIGYRSTDGGAKVMTPIPKTGSLLVNDPNAIVESLKDPYIVNFEKNTNVTYWTPIQVPFTNISNNTVTYDCTILQFNRAMSSYDTGWDDEILVSFTSPVGPNTVDIIQWLIQTYTQFQIDASSFLYVRGLINQFPSHFTIIERKNILTMLEEICYQARLGLLLKNGTFFLKYLSLDEDPVDTITENDIEYSSLELSYTPTEDLVTKSVSSFKFLYENKKPNQIVLRYNINKYDSIEKKYDYYIYNIAGCVYQSAVFWLIRKGNTWKKLKFKTFLNKLNLEPMDTVLLNFGRSFVSTEPVKAIVESCKYDSATYTIDFEVWVPVRIGEMTPYPFAWPSGVDPFFFFPTNEEITDGRAGDPALRLQGSVPGAGVTYKTDNSIHDMPGLYWLQRPRDWGPLNISDDKNGELMQIYPHEYGTVSGTPGAPGIVTVEENASSGNRSGNNGPGGSVYVPGQTIDVGSNGARTITSVSSVTNGNTRTTTLGVDPPLSNPVANGTRVLSDLGHGGLEAAASDKQDYSYREYKRPTAIDYQPPKPPQLNTSPDGKSVPAFVTNGPVNGLYTCDSYPQGLDNDAVSIKVKILQIDSSAVIPEGTALFAVKIKNHFYGQVAVWI